MYIQNTGSALGAQGRKARAHRVAVGLLASALLSFFMATQASAQADDAFSRITAQDITEALLALNNLVASPGLEGSNLHVDPTEIGLAGSIKYNRASLQLPIFVATKIEWLEVLIDVGVGGLDMDDRYSGVTSGGDAVAVRSMRSVTTGRLGIGPSFVPIEGLNISPYLAASFGGFSSKSTTQPASADLSNLTPGEEALLKDWSALIWGVAGVFDVQYVHWLREKRHRVDLMLRYAVSYSSTLNESLPILESSGVTNSLNGEAIFRTITGWKLFNHNLGWNVFTTAGGFPGQEVDDLGFTYTFGFGAGLDFYFPDKIFGIFDRKFIGVQVSGLVGDNNHGWSLVLHLRR
jgi:hypothetical protein